MTDEEFLSALDSRGIACDPGLALEIKEVLTPSSAIGVVLPAADRPSATDFIRAALEALEDNDAQSAAVILRNAQRTHGVKACPDCEPGATCPPCFERTLGVKAAPEVIGYVHKDWTPKNGQGRIYGHKPGPDYKAVALAHGVKEDGNG